MLTPRQEYEAQRAQIVKELGEVAPEPLRSRLSGMIRPAITLTTSFPSDDLTPLASKFGGAPDVPLGFEWPHFQDHPLDFVAQLNLEELVLFDVEERLPPSGLLSFWTNGAWGGEKEFGGWRAFHFQEDEWQRLDRQQPEPQGFWRSWFMPKETLPTFSAAVQPEVWASLANPWNCIEFREEERKDDSLNMFYDLCSGGHQMFGFPDSVQSDVREQAALNWNKFLDLPEANHLGLSPLRDLSTWEDWELLLQLQSDEGTGMKWGDASTLYFLIRRNALEARRFERCWSLFQFD